MGVDIPDALPRVVRPILETPCMSKIKFCPTCGEPNKATAQKCRSCADDLSGLEDTRKPPRSGIWRDGQQLVMTRDAELPFVCVKTNQPADVWLPRVVSWYPKWSLPWLLINPLMFLVAAVARQRQATLRVGLCRSRLVRRNWTMIAALIGVLLGLALFIAPLLWSDRRPANSEEVLIYLGILVLFISLALGGMLTNIVWATYINKDYIWLKGFHPDYLARFPEFPGVKD